MEKYLHLLLRSKVLLFPALRSVWNQWWNVSTLWEWVSAKNQRLINLSQLKSDEETLIIHIKPKKWVFLYLLHYK
jgi:hypothetical protein